MPRLPTKADLGTPSFAPPEHGIITGQQYGAGLVGQALEKAGGEVENAGNEIQQNTNHLETLQAEADRVLRTQEADQDAQRDPDFKTLVPRFQARLDEINTNASSLISNPNARAMFQARATAEAQRVLHEVHARATNLERQDAVDTLEDSAGKIALGIRSAATPDEAARRTDELEQAVRTFNPGLVDPNHQRRIIDKYIRGQGGIIGRIADDRAHDIAGKGFNAQWDNLKELEAAPGRGASSANVMPQTQDRGDGFATVGTRKGLSFTVAAGDPAQRFQGAINDLEERGYAINESGGGYDPRNIKGTRTPSKHAGGLAIDINPGQNQEGTMGDIPPDVANDVAKKWGLIWGGNWKDRRIGGRFVGPDPMHFEVDPNAGPLPQQPPQAPTKVAANDNATGVAAPMRWADIYARMDPATLSRKITNARNALHQSVLTEADGAEKIAETTGQIPRDNDGQTVLDHSRVLLPNQQTKVQYKVEGGLHRYNAVAPLADMDDAQFAQHYQNLDPANQKMSDGKTPLPYAIAAKNREYAAKVYAKIQDQRTGKNADVAQATMGAPLSLGKAPRVSDIGENGQPIITDVDDGADLKTHSSSEVTDVMRYIGGRYGDINSPDTDPAVKQKAWGLIFNARLATQRRWGVPERSQNVMTLDEARKLLGTNDFASEPKSQINGILQEAAKTAQERYGVYGRRALVDAIKVVHGRQKAENEGFDLGAGLLSGEIKPEDLDLSSRLIGRQDPGTILERGQQGRGTYAPTMPAPAPQPAETAPRLRNGLPPPRSGGFAPTSGVAPADVAPTPPSSGALTPSEGRANWLRNSLEAAKTEGERRDIRRAFDTWHRDPGAAKRAEERARQFFDQQDRGRS